MKVWKTVEPDRRVADDIVRKFGMPAAAADILCNLGLHEEEKINQFLYPRLGDVADPFLLPSMRKAVCRIWRAIDARESIAIYGDYDVDGITSTGLLLSVLRGLGASRVTPFLPDRISDGYGFSVEVLERCVRDSNPGLLITVDCGTNAHEAVKTASSLGVDVIVTDHHEIAGMPCGALAVVNPKLGEDEHLKMLAGVGVVFKLCYALVKFGRNEARNRACEIDLRDCLAWVALGTVADIVPLLGENRIFVKHGLAHLNRNKSQGLCALAKVAGISSRIDSSHIAYRLAPRLNAAGRVGHPDMALDLLMTDDVDRASVLALKLEKANRDRQKVESGILKEALSEVNTWFDPSRDFGIVVGKHGWHSGVIGIVGSRLVAVYGRPVVLVAFNDDGIGRGSSRSVEGYSLIEGLNECGDYLASFGGHEMAAGFEIRVEQFEKFKSAFNLVAADKLKGRDLRPVQRINSWIRLSDANDALLECLECFQPFGQDNPAPVFAARGLRFKESPRRVGENHLRMTLVSGGVERNAIAFGMADRMLPEGPFEAAFKLERSMYERNGRMELHIADIRESPQEASC